MPDGVVMIEPVTLRTVWVAAKDRADFEARGYLLGEREEVRGPAEVRAPAEVPTEDVPEVRGGVTFPKRVSRGRGVA